jgi:NitT/TauT family transport system substrate-binding protein
MRIVAGAARGGAALVVQSDGRIKTPADFRGKKVATPQLGNTQDVACRAWLIEQGFKVTQAGGDVTVIPTANPDQITLFKNGSLDAVWTVEPWVSRLESEAKGVVFLEEKDAITTVLATSTKLLKDRPEEAKKILAAHQELTEWIKANPAEAQKLVQEELKADTTKEVPLDLIAKAWARLDFSATLEPGVLEKFVAAARRVGFLSEAVDVSGMLVKP